jgi:hypothetical protein
LLQFKTDIPPTALLTLYLSDVMGEDPVLPELYQVLGEKGLIALMRVFGGRMIRVPSVASVRKAYEAVRMFQEVESRRSGSGLKASIKQAAKKLRVEPAKVDKSHQEIDGILKALQGVLDGE